MEEDKEDNLEFVMDPWVLVQLPFQPTLLHQWSIALLAEYLQFESAVCCFHRYATATSTTSKVKLAKTTIDQIRAFAEYTLTATRAFLSDAYANSRKKTSTREFWRMLMTTAIPLADVLKTVKKMHFDRRLMSSTCDCDSGQDFKKVWNKLFKFEKSFFKVRLII